MHGNGPSLTGAARFLFPFGNAKKSGCGSIYLKSTTEASDYCFSALWNPMYWNF